jgi:tetratricopeptide (TPR) repeat protein
MSPGRFLIIGFVCAVLVGSVSAQPARDDRVKAASHFKQGQLYFKNGDYDRARSEYQAAYSLSQEPLLLFNIALCNDRAQRPEKALEGFQHYLDLAPEGEVADEAREDVTRLTPIVDAIRAKRAAEQQAAEAQRAEQDRQAARHAEEARKADAQKRERERRQAAETIAMLERRAKLQRWGGIAAAGTGVVALVLGAKYGLDARSAGEAITNHNVGGWTDALLANDTNGHAASTKMIILTSIGGVCVLGGGVLYWLGNRTHREAEQLRLTVHAVPIGDGAAFALSGTF